MPIAIGAQLGTYEVRALLGAGGMGEVYRAHDSKLGREVAIKVLPDAWASDSDRLARFEREAKVLASLNHPHIAALYGMEDAGAGSAAVRFLVMELVEGETLADRLRQGALPPREAVRVATQIAAAVEAAHERGVVHRDLKPANVKITPDDQVKVLDFGLAKLNDPNAPNGPNDPNLPSASPTLSVMATQAGVILGTAAYMSPEQAKGAAVDHRSDLFSFGGVLYEMLTGRPPFGGDTAAEILASVLIRDPDFAALPPNLNPRLVDLVRRCFDKNPKKRWQAAGDLRAELEIVAASAETSGTDAASATRPAGSVRRERLAWSVAAVAALAAIGVGVLHFREAPPEAAPIRTTILAPEGTTLEFTNGVGLPAISPDGRRIVFGARTSDGRRPLWVRPLDGLAAQQLAGTDGAAFPFWSPDSRSIAFFADGKLKKIDAAGGAALTLADAPQGRGGSWSHNGVIVFSPRNGVGLERVSSAGGASSPVTMVQGSFPWFLPDGVHFLFQDQSADDFSFRIGSLDDMDTPLVGAGSNAMYAEGHLLFLQEGTLMAQPFDPDRLATTGEPILLAESVQTVLNSGRVGIFSVADTGALLYRAGVGSRQQLTWFDRTGRAVGTVGDPDDDLGGYPELSPDGRRLTVERNVDRYPDIWTFDLERGGVSRFTFDPGNDRDPMWSPDGSQIVFSSNRKAGGPSDMFELYVKPSSGAGAERLLVEASGMVKTAYGWSADRVVLYREVGPKSLSDLWVLPMQGDQKPEAIANSRFAELNGQFSPDGRWIAYQSNESGRPEIYVVPYPPGGGKWQVSTGGGFWPRWCRDGREVFFVALDGKMMAAGITISPTPSFQAAPPIALFETPFVGIAGLTKHQYVVSADGRFLMTVPLDPAGSMTLLQNWAPRP